MQKCFFSRPEHGIELIESVFFGQQDLVRIGGTGVKGLQ
jgi:hypothetical protein